ncbi:choice-of-anchor G family protein [Cryobacterium serini]|uniref:Choice-of-anchor G family protein n=1 Tax=Cryobacterium serini TaxID=1259201 RepID=A0A4R9BQB7_9MICO|nr:choice-of-anchor G family protein [Cryobacterium serini]TFD88921.1 choice-of-anchor G family protein [Cryobacterium serini]
MSRRVVRTRPRHRRPGRARRATALGLIVVGTLLAATVQPAIERSFAAWTDTEWTHGSVGTDLMDCGIDTGYSSMAAGIFLAATVAGVSLDSAVGMNGLRATRDGNTSAKVVPSSAQHPDAGDADATTDTFTNPLTVSVIQQGVLNLTGLNAGLPVGAAGVIGEYARVSNTGSSAGASGLVNDSGGIGFTPATASAQLPTAASLNLASVLPARVASTSLSIGAVAASAQLDWCAALESSIWGDGTVSGIQRDYEIASLGLVMQVPALKDVLTSATSTVSSFVNSELGSKPEVARATDLLANPVIVADSMTVDLAQGTVSMNLASLLSASVNDQAPNTTLGLNAAKVTGAVARVSTLVRAWASAISTELQIAKSMLSVLLTTLLGTLNAALDNLASVLNTTVTALTPTLNEVFSALPRVLSLTVNVQPDQPNALTGATFTAATPTSSAEYQVSALHIELLGYSTGTQLATATFATGSAGANARLP